MIRQQAGVALFQVLLVSAILTLLCLHINREAQQHVDLASQLETRSRMLVRAHSTESAVLYVLLTSPWRQLEEPRYTSDLAASWNFNGQPVQWQGARLELTNLSSLIEATSRGRELPALISQASNGKVTVDGAAQLLTEWQQKYNYPLPGPNSKVLPLQYPQELMLAGISPLWFEQISALLTTYPAAVRNPFMTPEALWPVYFDSYKVEELKQLKLNGMLSTQAFSLSTGAKEDEFSSASNGPWFRIRFTVSEGDVTLNRQLDIGLQPAQSEPILVWDYLPATYFFGSHLFHEKSI